MDLVGCGHTRRDYSIEVRKENSNDGRECAGGGQGNYEYVPEFRKVGKMDDNPLGMVTQSVNTPQHIVHRIDWP